jgi:hypothetical protein
MDLVRALGLAAIPCVVAAPTSSSLPIGSHCPFRRLAVVQPGDGASIDALDLPYRLIVKPLTRRPTSWAAVGRGGKAVQVNSLAEPRTAVLAAADDNGIRFLFTSGLVPRRVGQCWVLERVRITAGTSAARVQDLSAHRGWGTALFVRRCSVATRTAVRPLYRAYVRNRTRETIGEMAR